MGVVGTVSGVTGDGEKLRELFREEPGLDRGNVELLSDSEPPGDPMLADELLICSFLPLKCHWDFLSFFVHSSSCSSTFLSCLFTSDISSVNWSQSL